jgi:predicted flavoprotein YhiN
VSDDGNDVLKVFETLYAKFRDRVSIHYDEAILSVSKNHEEYIVTTGKGEYTSEVLVLAP